MKIHENVNFYFTRYSVTIPPDGAFGAELPNGTWTGMVGMIQNEQADLVVSSLTINPEREKVIDFTYPFLFDHVTVVYAKPRERKWRTLIKPFETNVIVMIGVSLIVMSFVYCLEERRNPLYQTVSKRQSPSLYHSFLYMYGALLSQGGEPLPASLAGRTLVSCWWIFCIVSIAVYSGNLTASLTIHKTKLPFTSLEEMVNQNEYKWGTLGSSVFQTVFEESTVPTYAAIWNGIVEFNKSDPSVLSKSGEEHLQKLYNGNYAFIMAKQYIDFETTGHCNLVLLNEHLARNEVAFALANNSPCVRILSNAILSLHEYGLIDKWKDYRWPQTFCNDQKRIVVNNISVEDIQSAFYLIGIGVCLSCISLLCEKIMHLKSR
ncbi:glutamate receptor ionotropic, kainate glr-3-like [Mytilus californianus]|uniref:glutamate receptor ionotropic, kainate glr-3-like n=1 Tax=Mytilus californianus TaxID=6549 RepID=UPI002245CC06|nr:glutamate receptor ionotropic, kainate glr-3-like [Mytilus californianus]